MGVYQGPSQRDLQQTKKLREQVLGHHREQLGKHADEQRRKLKRALKEGHEKAKKSLEKLKHLAQDHPKHEAHEDEHKMHAAHELDHMMHELHKTATEIQEQHGAQIQEADAHHGADLFQAIFMFIIILRKVKTLLGERKQKEAKRLADECKAALREVKSAARK